MVITPRITKFDVESPYIDVMSGKKTALEAVLSGEDAGQNTLAPETALQSDKFNKTFKAMCDVQNAVDQAKGKSVTDFAAELGNALKALNPGKDVVVTYDPAKDPGIYYYFKDPKKGSTQTWGVTYRIVPAADAKLPTELAGKELSAAAAIKAGEVRTTDFGGYTVQVVSAEEPVRAYLASLEKKGQPISAGTPGSPMEPGEERRLVEEVNIKRVLIDKIQEIPQPLQELYKELVKSGLKFGVIASNNADDPYQFRRGEKTAYASVFDGVFVITREAYELMKDPTAPSFIANELYNSKNHELAELAILEKEYKDSMTDKEKEDLRRYAHLKGLMAERPRDPKTKRVVGMIPAHIDRWIDMLVSKGRWDTIRVLIEGDPNIPNSGTAAQHNLILGNTFIRGGRDNEAGEFAINLANHIERRLLNYFNVGMDVDGIKVFFGPVKGKIATSKVDGNVLKLVNKEGKELELKVIDWAGKKCVQLGNANYLVRDGQAIDVSKLNPLGNPALLDFFFDGSFARVAPGNINYALPVDEPARCKPADMIPVNPLQQPELYRPDAYQPEIVDAAREALDKLPEEIPVLDDNEFLNLMHNAAIVGLNGAMTQANKGQDYYEAQALLTKLKNIYRGEPQRYNMIIGLADTMLFSFTGCDWKHWQDLSDKVRQQIAAAPKAAAAKTFLDAVAEDGTRIVEVEVPDVSRISALPDQGDVYELGAQAIQSTDKGVGQVVMAGGQSNTVRSLIGYNKLTHLALKVVTGIRKKMEMMINVIQARLGLILGQNPSSKITVITSYAGTNLGESDGEIRTSVNTSNPEEFDSGQISLAVQRSGLALNPKTGFPLRWQDNAIQKGQVVTCAENHLWALMALLMDKKAVAEKLRTTNGIMSIGNGDNIFNIMPPGMAGTLLQAREQEREVATLAVTVPSEGDKKCGVWLKITYEKPNGEKITREEFRETSEFPTRDAKTGYSAVVIPKDDPRYAEYERKGFFIEDMLKDNKYPVNVAFYAIDLKLIIARFLGIDGPVKQISDEQIVQRLDGMSDVEWKDRMLQLAYKVRAVPSASKKVANEDNSEKLQGYVEEQAIQNLIVNGLPLISPKLEAVTMTANRKTFAAYKGVPQPILDENGNQVTDPAVIAEFTKPNAHYGEQVVTGNNVYDLIANQLMIKGSYDRLKNAGIPMLLGNGRKVESITPITSLDEIKDKSDARFEEVIKETGKQKAKRLVKKTFVGVNIDDSGLAYPQLSRRLDCQQEGGEIEKYAPTGKLDVYFSVKVTKDGSPVGVDEMSDEHFKDNARFYFQIFDEGDNRMIDTIAIDDIVRLASRNPATSLYDGIEGLFEKTGQPKDQSGMRRFVVTLDLQKMTGDLAEYFSRGVHNLNIKVKVVLPNGTSKAIGLGAFSPDNPVGDLKLKKLVMHSRSAIMPAINPTHGMNPAQSAAFIRQYLDEGIISGDDTATRGLDQITGLLEAAVVAHNLDKKQKAGEKLSDQEKIALSDNTGAFADAVFLLQAAGGSLARELPLLPLLRTAMGAMDPDLKKALVEEVLPAYIKELEAKPALSPRGEKDALPLAKAVLAVDQLSNAAVAGAEMKVNPDQGTVEIAGKQPVPIPPELKGLLSASGIETMIIGEKAASPVMTERVLMELATRKQIADAEKGIIDAMEKAKMQGEQLNIDMRLIAEITRADGKIVNMRSRGVGFAKMLDQLIRSGVQVNIISDLRDEAISPVTAEEVIEVLSRAEGVRKETIAQLMKENKLNIILAKSPEDAIAQATAKKAVEKGKSRYLVDQKATLYPDALKTQGYPYLIGKPGVSIAALVSVIMTVENPMDNAQVMAELKKLGIDAAQYEGQAIPPAKQTESMLKYLYNNPRAFETAA